jgi:hypothetical protein
MSHINVAQHDQYEQQSKDKVVTVKLKRGDWEVEITCREDNVKQVVESVLSGMSNKIEKVESKHVEKRGHATCKGLIEELWKENWFVEEHTLSEVHEELKRRGYNYDKTAVSHALTDLVREGILSRVGTMRAYRYIQKRPSS